MSDSRSKQVAERPASPYARYADEGGMALLTVVMVLLMVTGLGIAAMTVTAMENKMAGLQRTMTAAEQAAESCLSTSTNVINTVMLPESGGAVPASLLAPTGPVVTTGNNPILLGDEIILGTPQSHTDVATGTGAAPNLQMTVAPYDVFGDIDFVYSKPRSGNPSDFANCYNNPRCAANGGLDNYYRVTCTAANSATGTESRLTIIYACAVGDGCQRQP